MTRVFKPGGPLNVLINHIKYIISLKKSQLLKHGRSNILKINMFQIWEGVIEILNPGAKHLRKVTGASESDEHRPFSLYGIGRNVLEICPHSSRIQYLIGIKRNSRGNRGRHIWKCIFIKKNCCLYSIPLHFRCFCVRPLSTGDLEGIESFYEYFFNI